MRYKVLYVDSSVEFVDEDSIADARREANCLYNCPVKSIIAQESHDCDEDEVLEDDDELDAEEDDTPEEDEDEKGDDD